MSLPYDAILFVSFGGPEGPDDVIPFLENVLRGKNVPRERMMEVAEHYQHFGGVSPINGQNRELIGAIEKELGAWGPKLPIFWGNRNWHPMLAETLQEMADRGIKRALAFVTSGFSCYSGCRQYRENIEAARQQVNGTAPTVDKIRVFYNHPAFVVAMADRVQAALAELPEETRDAATICFTAHSIPNSMAENSRYEMQLRESSRLIASELGRKDWKLVYQSRSGPPTQPWLEPDVCDWIKQQHSDRQLTSVVVTPLGFVSDHMEVMFDLDTEARELCEELGVPMARAKTAGTHPNFVRMCADLIRERCDPNVPKEAIGAFGPSHDVCPEDCCLYTPARRPAAAQPGNSTT